MRLIDADALKEHTEIVSYKNEWYETEIDEFVSVETIDSAPSTDICFCRECKRAEHEPSGVRCGLSDVLMGEDGFCSIGERKEQ